MNKSNLPLRSYLVDILKYDSKTNHFILQLIPLNKKKIEKWDITLMILHKYNNSNEINQTFQRVYDVCKVIWGNDPKKFKGIIDEDLYIHREPKINRNYTLIV